MDDLQQKGNSLFGIEDVALGDRSSFASKVVFLLLCFVPLFSTLLFGAVDNITWVFISIAWALIALSWIAETWRAGGLLLNTSSLQIPLAGLLLIGLIQLLPLGGSVSGLSVPASRALSLDPYSTQFFVVKLAVYLVYFSACLAFINNEKRLKKAVYFIIIFGSVMSLYGILQRLASPDGIYGVREASGARPFGPFINQHHFATFMQMTAGLAAALLFGRTAGKEQKILLAAAVVVTGVATLWTGSRGGFLGFLATLIFVGLLNFLSGRWSGESRSKAGTQRNFVIAAAGIALIVVIFGVVLLLGGNDSLLRGIGLVQLDADASTGRVRFWPIALQIFWAHPILGAGLESFGVAFTKYDTMNGQFRVEQAHNEYLQTLADAGILGFICLTGFIFALFKKGLKAVATSAGFRNEAAIGALAGCLGVLVHSFFDFPLRTPSNAFFFLMLCAIATVSIVTDEMPSRRRHRSTAP